MEPVLASTRPMKKIAEANDEWTSSDDEVVDVSLESLKEAIGKGDKEARKLIRSNVPTDDDILLDDILLDASYQGEVKVVEFLLGAECVDINCQGRSWKQTPLSLAAERGHTEVVRLLLNHHANPNIEDTWERTALSWAAQYGYAKVVALLLEEKALPDHRDKDGKTPLLWAVENEKIEVLKVLLDWEASRKSEIKKKAQIPQQMEDHLGRTPLSYASGNGDKDTIQLLLSTKEVQPDYRDESGRTPLSYACENGHIDPVTMLLDAHADAKSKDKDDRTPFSWAAQKGHVDAARLLWEAQKSDINSKSSNGRTLLSWAAEGGSKELVELLLKENTVPDDQDKDGRTPLSWAAGAGHGEVVELFLQQDKIEPDRKDATGRTPLSWAAGKGHEDVLELLVGQEKIVNADNMDNDGRTPLSWAAAAGHEEVVSILLSKALEHDQKDAAGRTPLSWAAEKGQENILELLVRKGKAVNTDNKDKSGRTPLSWAAGAGQEEAVRFLLSNGVKPDQKDAIGRTPLSWAAGRGDVDVVKPLVKLGVDIDCKDDQNRAPLSWAAENGQYDVVEYLLSKVKEFDDEDLEHKTPLSRAVEKEKNGWYSVMGEFLDYGMEKHPGLDVDKKTEELSWASKYLHQAAKKGWVELVRELLDRSVAVDSRDKDEQTPLCLAAQEGHEEVVLLLLDHKADPKVTTSTKDTPLDLAQRSEHHGVIRILSKLSQEGALAFSADDPELHAEVDGKFKATVVELFQNNSDDLERKQPFVRDLLTASKEGTCRFRWVHLPANNMRWVEALVAKYYSKRKQKGLPYTVLKPERWVGRQHQGPSGSHHTRFMKPLCEIIPEMSIQSHKVDGSKAEAMRKEGQLVLFMPFLHWETEEILKRRKRFVKELKDIKERSSEGIWKKTVEETCSKDEYCELLDAYLDNQHPLHIRRTLDQYYHHTLKDTSSRDKDQVVSRYQRRNPKGNTLVTTMVDQLWLWVLVGEQGRADTVISCFPPRSRSMGPSQTTPSTADDPDPSDLTDVVENIWLHIRTEPSSVKTAYDLAGVIASKCSRVYLDAPNSNKVQGVLQFLEIYETSIGNVREKEHTRFDQFMQLMNKDPGLSTIRSPDGQPFDLESRILELIGKFRQNLQTSQKIDLNYNRPSLDRIKENLERNQDYGPVSIREAIKLFHKKDIEDIGRFMEVLQEIGHIQSLDISNEIELIHEVRNIRHELSILAVLFEEQKKVLKTMESNIRSINSIKGKLQVTGERPQETPKDKGKVEKDKGLQRRKTGFDEKNETRVNEGAERLLDPERQDVKDQVPPGKTNEEGVPMRSRRMEPRKEEPERTQPVSEVWGANSDPKESSLPLATVQLSIGEVGKMIAQAKDAYDSLDFLLNLKQKQSNAMEARLARREAEESRKLTKITIKQGNTIMVFTVVTITFLPMSFIAAFFAMDIRQFHTNDGLDLKFVLSIIFPISAAIIFPLATLAFNVDKAKNWCKLGTGAIFEPLFNRKKKDGHSV